MFKSIRSTDSTSYFSDSNFDDFTAEAVTNYFASNNGYILSDSRFIAKIPALKSKWDSINGLRYFLPHNKKYANSRSDIIECVLSIILEYKKRNLNITKNLALYYISLGKSRSKLNNILSVHKVWFAQYSPELDFDKLLKCVLYQIKQHGWINSLHNR